MSSGIYLVISLLMTSFGGWAGQVFVLHSGSTDPTTEGWGGGGSGVTGPPAAWNISGSWCCSYDTYPLASSPILGQLASATNFDLTAIMANLDPSTGPGGFGRFSVGTNVEFSIGGPRYDLNLSADGSGGQVLSLDPFSSGTPYVDIPGVGTGYVTLDLLYTDATGEVDAYVNGQLVISGFAGHNNFDSTRLSMGSANGDFALVRLATDVSSVFGATAPEPTPVACLAVAGLGLFSLRRRGSGSRRGLRE